MGEGGSLIGHEHDLSVDSSWTARDFYRRKSRIQCIIRGSLAILFSPEEAAGRIPEVGSPSLIHTCLTPPGRASKWICTRRLGLWFSGAGEVGMQRTTYLLTLSVLALLPFCHRARAGAPIRTVAVTGDAAPGTAGGVFGDIYWGPVINENGQVAFQAELQSGIGGVSQTDDMGIWSEGPGTLSLVAREGDQAPGAPSQTFFADIHNSGLGVLDDSGRLAYNGDH